MNRTAGPGGGGFGGGPSSGGGLAGSWSAGRVGRVAPDTASWPVASRAVSIPHADSVPIRRLRRAVRRSLEAARRKVPWPYALRCTAEWRDVLGPAAVSAFQLEVRAPRDPARFLDAVERAFRDRFAASVAAPRWRSWFS